jgi:glutathione peroxidase
MATTAQTEPDFVFPSIKGGDFRLSDWRGKPVLVINTASMCGYTKQYAGMQSLADLLGPRGIVLAVPSDDFAQEYSSEDEVAGFCEMTFGLKLPMTRIEHVAKGDVHPFYAWVRDTAGFVPDWNFNKVLIGPDGSIAATFGSEPDPMDDEIKGAVLGLLA